MPAGAFYFVLAMCGAIWGSILLVWWLGLAFGGGALIDQSREMTATALIAYILFGVGLVWGLWRDAERERADKAFQAEMCDEIAGIKKAVANIQEQKAKQDEAKQDEVVRLLRIIAEAVVQDREGRAPGTIPGAPRAPPSL